MTAAAPDPPAPPAPAPATLTWAVRLLFVEALGLAVLTGYLVVQDSTVRVADPAVGIALTVAAAATTAAVALLARALAHRAARARGPAVVIQLLLLLAGNSLIRGGAPGWGVPLVLLALAAGVLMVLPPTTRALGLG